jgi:hypothetical protein
MAIVYSSCKTGVSFCARLPGHRGEVFDFLSRQPCLIAALTPICVRIQGKVGLGNPDHGYLLMFF